MRGHGASALNILPDLKKQIPYGTIIVQKDFSHAAFTTKEREAGQIIWQANS
ncbi:hypothetical protein MASR2M70_07770 [Bacillota bacterium]